MRAILPSISMLLFGVVLLLLGNGLLGTLLGIRLAAQGTPEIVTGLVMSAYFAGLVGGSLLTNQVIGAVGHIRTFAAFASIFSAAVLAHGFFPDPAVWGALRLVEGFCMAGLFMCTESWLNARADNQTRGQVLSLYMISVYLAQGMGQFLLTIPDPTGLALLALSSVLLSLALVPVALSRGPAPPIPEPSPFGMRALHAISPFGVFGAFASGIAMGAFYGLGPVYAHGIGLDVDGTAGFMGAAIFGGLLLQWPIGRLSDRIDRRTVLTGVGAMLGVVSFVAIATPPTAGLLLGLVVGLFGGFCFALYPLSVAHANDFIEPRDVVSASGGLLLAYSVGAVLGPLGGAAIMSRAGPAGLFLFCGLVGLAAAGFGLWRMRQRPPKPLAEQAPFLALPRTTPLSTELDPRGGEEEPRFDFGKAAVD